MNQLAEPAPIVALDLGEQAVPRQVFLFSGHMVDAADRTSPRFPQDKEPVAAAAIGALLDELDAGSNDRAISKRCLRRRSVVRRSLRAARRPCRNILALQKSLAPVDVPSGIIPSEYRFPDAPSTRHEVCLPRCFTDYESSRFQQVFPNFNSPFWSIVSTSLTSRGSVLL